MHGKRTTPRHGKEGVLLTRAAKSPAITALSGQADGGNPLLVKGRHKKKPIDGAPPTPFNEEDHDMNIEPHRNKPCDIIADTHGYAAALRALLEKLGYTERNGVYFHPECTALFLGDFIDKGPAIRETLQIVKAMVDAGTALAVMGNHEYNAICYHTWDDKTRDYFRPRTDRNVGQHEATMREFEGRGDELKTYLEWFGTLPLFLDMGGFRVAHACWDTAAIAALGGSNLYDEGLLAPPDAKKDPRHAALNILIKGPENPTPGGVVYGDGRGDMRVKWWLNERPLNYRNAALQVPFELPLDPLTAEEARKVCGYPADAPPIFFGHYGYLKPAEPFAPNVACIDLGGHGPLCAYRWDGEQVLDAGKFVTAAR